MKYFRSTFKYFCFVRRYLYAVSPRHTLGSLLAYTRLLASCISEPQLPLHKFDEMCNFSSYFIYSQFFNFNLFLLRICTSYFYSCRQYLMVWRTKWVLRGISRNSYEIAFILWKFCKVYEGRVEGWLNASVCVYLLVIKPEMCLVSGFASHPIKLTWNRIQCTCISTVPVYIPSTFHSFLVTDQIASDQIRSNKIDNKKSSSFCRSWLCSIVHVRMQFGMYLKEFTNASTI